MNQKNASGQMVDWFSKNKVLALFFLVFSVAMVTVFAKVFSPWTVISSPDDAPFYAQNHFVAVVEPLLSGASAFTPFILSKLFAQIGLHEVRYMASVLLLALSGAYYLRTLRVDVLAAYGGGLFLALSGYIFTLFSAGHLGFFWLMGGFFWAFGLLNRCLDSGRSHHFLLLGAVVMWAQPGQPDVWVLFAAVFAFYALWRFWLARSQLKKALPKFLLTILVAGLIGMPGARSVLTQHLAGRDKQIADVMRPVAGQGADTGGKHSPERWDFATGWSLPPSDCAEFLVPGFFGDASFHPPYPFWGKLGSVPEETEKKPWPNYRQHTVYLGLVTVMMAVIGVLAWIPKRREAWFAEPVEAAADFRDVPFWCVVGLGALALAMGRYTPCYRLFYSLPYMDYLRAPVKFLHFTELAVGLLAGFGLHALLKRERVSGCFARNVFFVMVGFVVCLGVAALMALGYKGAMEKHIAGLGFGLGSFASTLSGYAVYNCFRAVGLAVAVAGLMYFWWKQKLEGTAVRLAVCGIVLLGVGDLTAVARRYVQPRDVRVFHAENALVKDMLQRTSGVPVNAMNYVTQNAYGQDWLNTSLHVHGLSVLLDATDPNAKERPLAIALQNNPLRLWDTMGVRFILLPRQQAEQLIQQRAATLVGEYEIGNGMVRKSATPSGQTVALLERKALAFPCIHFDWAGDTQADKHVEQLVQSGKLIVTDAPTSGASEPLPPQPVTFSRMRGMRNVFTSRAEVEVPKPGLLVWNERYSPDLVAALNGKPVPLYQANGIWCAVQVPAGKHTVTCRMRTDGWLNFLAIATSLLVAISPFVLRKPRP